MNMSPYGYSFQPTTTATPAPRRERGAALNGILGLGFVGSTFTLVASVFTALWVVKLAGAADVDVDPAKVANLYALKNFLLFGAFLAAIRLACLGAILGWKRWGVYGYAALASFGVLLAFKTSVVSGILSAAVLLLVLAKIASRWTDFE